jgi:prolyl-tRNA editing enzyme YbaK/EbsC (Cys-tRNA(Pro) deacylase)
VASSSEGADPPLAASALRVQAALDALGIEARVRELDVPARTAQEAADALGVPVGAIAKSLVFRAASAGAVMVVAAGDRRVDEARIGAALGEPIGRADAAFVRQATGYAIGGIPPLGHATPLVLFVDASLVRFETVWAAGGTPHAVFPIGPQALFGLPGARVMAVAWP